MFDGGLNNFGKLFLDEIGFAPSGVAIAWAVKLSHIVCTVLLLFNKYVIPACLATIVVLILEVILVHFKEGWFVVGGGRNRMEYNLQNWLRNRSTIEFVGLWEQFNNPNFNSIEFDGIKSQAGSNSFSFTPKRWIEVTNAIGIISKTGKYGGTFALRNIAFEFATWISAEFKLYIIKEFQRVKADESDRLKLDWNL